MAFNRNLLATAAAIVLLVLSAPSDQAGAVPPETGVWSVGASAGVIGNPVSAGDGANTIRFTATSTGDYQYICPMPGHAQMGMHGAFNVR